MSEKRLYIRGFEKPGSCDACPARHCALAHCRIANKSTSHHPSGKQIIGIPKWCPLEEAEEPACWISVEDSLPDSDEMMLVSCRTKKGISTVNRAYFSDGFWHGSGSMSGVVAWMPLPKPYEEV